MHFIPVSIMYYISPFFLSPLTFRMKMNMEDMNGHSPFFSDICMTLLQAKVLIKSSLL